MLSLTAPALPAAVVDLLCTPTSSDSHFYWQETAYQALAQSRAASNLPYLVLNMAGTGSGKTRMNARAACGIGDRHGEGIRFATALNLRTLTLQTGDAYSEQLHIPANQCPSGCARTSVECKT
jgi:CRISPR-associated endonuclease/helicase Cas3